MARQRLRPDRRLGASEERARGRADRYVSERTLAAVGCGCETAAGLDLLLVGLEPAANLREQVAHRLGRYSLADCTAPRDEESAPRSRRTRLRRRRLSGRLAGATHGPARSATTR